MKKNLTINQLYAVKLPDREATGKDKVFTWMDMPVLAYTTRTGNVNDTTCLVDVVFLSQTAASKIPSMKEYMEDFVNRYDPDCSVPCVLIPKWSLKFFRFFKPASKKQVNALMTYKVVSYMIDIARKNGININTVVTDIVNDICDEKSRRKYNGQIAAILNMHGDIEAECNDEAMKQFLTAILESTTPGKVQKALAKNLSKINSSIRKAWKVSKKAGKKAIKEAKATDTDTAERWVVGNGLTDQDIMDIESDADVSDSDLGKIFKAAADFVENDMDEEEEPSEEETEAVTEPAEGVEQVELAPDDPEVVTEAVKVRPKKAAKK